MFSFPLFWRLNQLSAIAISLEKGRSTFRVLFLLGLIVAIGYGLRSFKETGTGEAIMLVGILVLAILILVIMWPNFRRDGSHHYSPDVVTTAESTQVISEYQRFVEVLHQQKHLDSQEKGMILNIISYKIKWDLFQKN